MESILSYWEGTDEKKWSSEERDEAIEALTLMSWSQEQWMRELLNVPVDVTDRYKKIMQLLLKSGAISSYSYDEEMKVMVHFSPATMNRRGREFADWYRTIKS